MYVGINTCINNKNSVEIYTYTFDFLKRFYTQNDRVRVNKATSTRTRYKFIFSTSLLRSLHGVVVLSIASNTICLAACSNQELRYTFFLNYLTSYFMQRLHQKVPYPWKNSHFKDNFCCSISTIAVCTYFKYQLHLKPIIVS